MLSTKGVRRSGFNAQHTLGLADRPRTLVLSCGPQIRQRTNCGTVRVVFCWIVAPKEISQMNCFHVKNKLGGNAPTFWPIYFTNKITLATPFNTITCNRVTRKDETPPPKLFVPAPCFQSFGGALDGAHVQSAEQPLVLEDQSGELVWQGEDDVEVRHGQQLSRTRSQPLGARVALALWAVAITA